MTIGSELIGKPLEERAIDRTDTKRYLPVYVASTDRHFDITELRILDDFDEYIYNLMGTIPRLTGGIMMRHLQGSEVLYIEACDIVGQRPDLALTMGIKSHDSIEDIAERIALINQIQSKKDELGNLYRFPLVWEIGKRSRSSRKSSLEEQIGNLQKELDEGRIRDLNEREATALEIFMRYTIPAMKTLGEIYAGRVRVIDDGLTRKPEAETYSKSVWRVRTSLNGHSYEQLFDIFGARAYERGFNTGDMGIMYPDVPEQFRRGNALRIDGFSEQFRKYYGDRFTLRDLYMHGDQKYMSNAHVLLYAFRSALIINAINDILIEFAGAPELASWDEASTRKHLAPLIGARNLEGSRAELVRNRGGFLGFLTDISIYACNSICDDLKSRGLVGRDLEHRTTREIEAFSETDYFDKLTVQNPYLNYQGRDIMVKLIGLDSIPKKDELLLALDQNSEEEYILTRYLVKVLDKLSTGHRYEGLLGPNITAELSI